MKVNITEKVEKDIKFIEVIAHCRDCCITQLTNGVGDVLYEHDGYVPAFLPNTHRDSLNLIIDLETGQIQNWPKITNDQLQKFIEVNDES